MEIVFWPVMAALCVAALVSFVALILWAVSVEDRRMKKEIDKDYRTLALIALFFSFAPDANPTNFESPQEPADLGAAAIDVSDYPTEYRRVYKEIFLKVYRTVSGGPVRAINSPLIELDPAAERALRKERPELFSDPRLADVSPDGWKREVLRVKNRPPCCGACSVLSTGDARALWKFLVYDSLRRKTGGNAASWIRYRRDLIEKFKAKQTRKGENK